ncbi:MAG: hypothetical protein AAF483_26555 [Planctomycetota bacterium]
MIRRRRNYADNFSIIDNRAVNDKRLSWEARGMLLYLMSKPDDWTVSFKNLQNQSRAGRDKVYGIMRELINCGYAKRVRRRSSDGTYGRCDYEISDIPLEESSYGNAGHG